MTDKSSIEAGTLINVFTTEMTTALKSMGDGIDTRMDSLESLIMTNKNLLTGNSHPETGLIVQVIKLNSNMQHFQEKITGDFEALEKAVAGCIEDTKAKEKNIQDKVWDILKPVLVAGVMLAISMATNALM